MIIKSVRARKNSLSQGILERHMCANDVFHAINKHFKIRHPIHGVHQMMLSAPQTRLLTEFESSDHVITLQPRRAGMTTAIVAYLAWDSMFKQSHHNIYLAPNTRLAQDAFETVDVILKNLCPTLGVQYNRVNCRFDFNNSSSLEFSSTFTAVKAKNAHHVALGDFAHVQDTWQPQLFQNAVQAAAFNGSLIVGSNPRRANDLFHKLWVDAITGVNGLSPVRVTWQEIMPPSQYLSLHQQLGAEVMSTEYDCEFMT